MYININTYVYKNIINSLKLKQYNFFLNNVIFVDFIGKNSTIIYHVLLIFLRDHELNEILYPFVVLMHLLINYDFFPFSTLITLFLNFIALIRNFPMKDDLLSINCFFVYLFDWDNCYDCYYYYCL